MARMYCPERTDEGAGGQAAANLLFGRDVTIYAPNNNGVSYKLGYTVGVNSCGAIFFGFFFWRLRRLKRWAEERRVSE